MLKFFQWLLIALKIVKSNGQFKDGTYRTAGVYWWNPLSYVVLLIASIIVAVYSGSKAIIQLWEDTRA